MNGQTANGQTANTLEHHLVRFIHTLRGLGVRVSTAETLEALAGLELADIMDRAQVKAVLRATLVKTAEDRPVFDRAFDLFFLPPEDRERLADARQQAAREMEARREQAEADLVFQGRPLELTDEHVQAYALLTPADRQKLMSFLEESSTGKKVGPNFQPLIQSLVQGHLDRWWRRMEEGREDLLDAAHTGDETLDAVIDSVSAEGAGLRDPLLHKDLKSIADRDLPRVTELVRLLSRKLATRISRRYRQSRRRRQIDLRRTIRANIRYGGQLHSLRYRAHRVQKPRLLLICDVSGSMSRYSSFVLQFVYGLSSVAGKIESFIFSEDLERVTPYFQRQRPFEETMAAVVGQSRQWARGTNLDAALATFYRDYLHALSPDTFVIIVSDTKTLCAGDAERRLARLRDRVREILWLNTVPRKEWGDLPTVAAFRRHCLMFECYTLAHLERVLRDEVWR